MWVWACLRFDRFHTFFNYGLLPSINYQQFRHIELWLYRFYRKQLFVYAYGSDVRSQARTKALGEFNCCMECPAVGKLCICEDDASLQNVQRVRRYATRTFSMGDMMVYTPGSDNSLFYWPIDVEYYQPCYPASDGTLPIRIVHAPNHRHFKGSRFLIEAVDRLKAQGFALELVLVEGVPNLEAREIYKEADIVADQFIIGFHGYFALEGMALGKPVLCYIRKQEYLIKPEECPIINCPAHDIEAVLISLLKNPSSLHRLGRAGREYIEKYHSIEAFTKRLEKTYVSCGVL